MNSQLKPVLIGRCYYDQYVRFPFHWAEEIKDEAERLSFKVIDLQKENFTEDGIDKSIKEHDPFFIFLNGHGTEWCVRGHNDEPTIQANKNDILLKDKIVYCVSCLTAVYLGPTSFDKGCKAYIGYEDDFIFWCGDLNSPSNDTFARMFMEASNQVALTILNSGTPKQAYQNSQKVYDEYIEYWRERWLGRIKTSVPPQMVDEILGALITDKEGQRVFWNES